VIESPGSITRRLAIAQASSREPVRALFVLRYLAEEFLAAGCSLLASEELAEEWAPRFSEQLDNHLRELWQSEGVEPPLEPSERAPHMFIGPKHPSFSGSFDQNCFDILEVISECDDQELNFIAACALAALSADKIYVVDGSRDAGVDVLGCWTMRDVGGLCICVQSKAWSGGLAGQHIEDIFNKFFTGSWKPVWDTYRSNLGASALPGLGRLLVVVSRDGFSQTAFDVARSTGVLCWGPRRLALTLASRFSASTLTTALASLCALPRDPSRNLANLLTAQMARPDPRF
jgi:hypothetical protein